MLALTISLLLHPLPAEPGRVSPALHAAQFDDVASADHGKLSAIRDAIGAGQLEAAATLLRVYEAENPGTGAEEIAVLEGELAVEHGFIGEAERLTAAVSQSGELACRVGRIRGLARAERDPGDASIDLLGKWTETCTSDWRVWAALGKLLAARGEGEASRFAFGKALEAPGRNGSVRIAYARALIALGDPAAAAAELQTSLGGATQDRQARDLLDYVNGMRGLEPERARDDNDQVWAERLTQAAQGARAASQPDLARALYAEALLVSPRYDQALLSEAARR